LNPRQSSGSPT